MPVMKPSGGTACCWGVAGDSVRWRTEGQSLISLLVMFYLGTWYEAPRNKVKECSGRRGNYFRCSRKCRWKGEFIVRGLQRAEEGPQDERQEGAGISSLGVSLPAQVTAGPWIREAQCLLQQISLQ